jgi:hypothetical protein
MRSLRRLATKRRAFAARRPDAVVSRRKDRRTTRQTERALKSNVVKNVSGTRLNAFASELEEGNPAKITSLNYLP